MTDVNVSAGYLDFKERRDKRIRDHLEILSEWYSEPTDLTLEIGCGHGHYLTAYAESYRQASCLGVDLVTKRISKANAKKDKRDLGNLRFLKGDIYEVIECLPEHTKIERVFILFPDPWPKKRHAKNRIIQHSLLEAIASKTASGTPIHFRTDHPDHFEWGKSHFAENEFWQIDESVPWPLEHTSFFQEMMDSFQSLTSIRR